MLALAATGLDLMTALSASVTAITNVGPALGPIAGPSGTFESFSDPAKYIMVVLMLLGRLELLTVLVLFAPDFWRS
jgi:trk system potassium uptake protein